MCLKVPTVAGSPCRRKVSARQRSTTGVPVMPSGLMLPHGRPDVIGVPTFRWDLELPILTSRQPGHRQPGCKNLLRRLHNRDAPWTAANFDTLQFFACLRIYNRHVVRRAVRRVKLRSIRAKRDSPGAVPNWNCCDDRILFRIDDRNGISSTCRDVKLSAVSQYGRVHRQRPRWQLDF